MTNYEVFLAGLEPWDNTGYNTARVHPTLVTVSQWLETENVHRSPAEITSEDLKVFEKAANLFPGSYELERSEHWNVVGLRARDVSQDWEFFRMHLMPPTSAWPYHTPGIDPTHVTVSQWLETQNVHRIPARITPDDLKDFEKAANLFPGSYERVRDNSRTVGLRARDVSQDWEYYRVSLSPPTPQWPYSTPGCYLTQVAVSQWLKTQGVSRPPTHLTSEDLKRFEKAAQLFPGSYQLVRNQHSTVVDVRARDLSQDWEYFRVCLNPPTPGSQYHTPGIRPTLETVSQWLETQNVHRSPANIMYQDLRGFERAANLFPGSYELVRNSSHHPVSLRDVLRDQENVPGSGPIQPGQAQTAAAAAGAASLLYPPSAPGSSTSPPPQPTAAQRANLPHQSALVGKR